LSRRRGEFAGATPPPRTPESGSAGAFGARARLLREIATGGRQATTTDEPPVERSRPDSDAHFALQVVGPGDGGQVQLAGAGLVQGAEMAGVVGAFPLEGQGAGQGFA